jgi:pimeloyl-ACP methyl ester carboxylesterase
MASDAIVLPSGKTATLAATPTLTPTNDQTPKEVPVENSRAVAFFIGGAGDKESYFLSGPYGNITFARDPFDLRIKNAGIKDRYTSYYLGYDEAKGNDVKKIIIPNIPNKATPVYIVGHSLGAWNGAHLSALLTDQGYKVEMLVTLDPVGEGALVWLGSDIYYGKPSPKCTFWINVRATPSKSNTSDSVASFGEQWSIESGPDINHRLDTNHENARAMFFEPLNDGVSAADYVYESILSYTGQ